MGRCGPRLLRWSHAPSCSVLLCGAAGSLASCLSSNTQTIAPAGHGRLLTTDLLQVASSHYFLSHHLVSSLHCNFKIYTDLVCFPVYLTPSVGLKFPKGRDLLSWSSQRSQHLAQWGTLSMCRINVCLMIKMNEEMYEITKFLFKVLIYSTLICYRTTKLTTEASYGEMVVFKIKILSWNPELNGSYVQKPIFFSKEILKTVLFPSSRAPW